jgi:phospholipid-transporting ATPase
MLGRSPRVVPGQENEARLIYINNPDLNEQQNYLHNRIFTGKYTAFTFLPKFLYEEFSKYANLFFLFISGIQVRTCINHRR